MRSDRERPRAGAARLLSSGRVAARKRRGAVLVLAAVVMVVLFAMTAFTVDVGYIAYTKTQLQSAVDAAALAGAQALPDGPGQARDAAHDVAGSNTAAGNAVYVAPDADVDIGLWSEATQSFTPLNGSALSMANAVRVTGRLTKARERQLNLFFAPVIGASETDVEATAIGMLDINLCGRIVGLDRVEVQNGTVDSYDSASGDYGGGNRGDEGHVCSNGPIVLDPLSSIRGNALPGPGYTVNRPDLVSGTTQPRRREIEAPPVDTSEVLLDNDNDLLDTVGLGSGGSISLAGNQSIDLPPGTYYIDGDFSVSGLASLSITGPTEIYVTGAIDVSGRGLVNTGRPADLKLYSTGQPVRIAGSAAFHGVVYAPLSAVEVAGTAAYYGAVVGKTLTLSGHPSSVHYDASLEPVVPEFARPVLVH
ncbi:MAG TPA: pilus assembly protein TadG-related protein [Planctomycetaceae bacterium]|nr:pilus assembly protein TadG-related protein [Planctomycetaceae bacterium]